MRLWRRQIARKRFDTPQPYRGELLHEGVPENPTQGFYQIVEARDSLTLWVDSVSGKKHQLRLHLGGGDSIVNDRFYPEVEFSRELTAR